MGDIEHLDFPFQTFGERVAKAVIAPVEGFIPILAASKDKTLGDYTMPEVLAWAAVGIYAGTVILAFSYTTAHVLSFLFRIRVVQVIRAPIPRR